MPEPGSEPKREIKTFSFQLFLSFLELICGWVYRGYVRVPEKSGCGLWHVQRSAGKMIISEPTSLSAPLWGASTISQEVCRKCMPCIRHGSSKATAEARRNRSAGSKNRIRSCGLAKRLSTAAKPPRPAAGFAMPTRPISERTARRCRSPLKMPFPFWKRRSDTAHPGTSSKSMKAKRAKKGHI